MSPIGLGEFCGLGLSGIMFFSLKKGQAGGQANKMMFIFTNKISIAALYETL